MKVDERDIIADEGKHLILKFGNIELGQAYSLGYIYYVNGVKLDEPIYLTPDDFEEVDNF